jgi:hypothetical protein
MSMFNLWLQNEETVQYFMEKGNKTKDSSLMYLGLLPSLMAAALEPSEDGTNLNSVERHEILIMEHLFEKRALSSLGQFVETVSRSSKLDLRKMSIHQSLLEKLIRPNKVSSVMEKVQLH